MRSEPGANDRLSDLTGFGSNPGALKARYHVPDDLADGAPLVVVLHGCTQSAAGYDHGSGWSRLADEAGFAVLFPEQQPANNANRCFNWFVPADARRGSGEALSIREMIEALAVKHGLDRKRIFVTGLSAGGAMASVMLATYPEIFAGGAIIAGLAYGSAATVPEAFDRMRGHGGPSDSRLQSILRNASRHDGPWPTISVWQGSADRTVAPSNADAIVAQWLDVHGLGETAPGLDQVDGQSRRIWSDADGRALIESYTVAGMGHGTPLKATGDDGLGAAGPFMLDVGISSTRRIAASWGIAVASPEPSRQPALQMPAAARGQASGGDKPRITATEELLERSAPPAASSGVQRIIEDALRKAGLMR